LKQDPKTNHEATKNTKKHKEQPSNKSAKALKQDLKPNHEGIKNTKKTKKDKAIT